MCIRDRVINGPRGVTVSTLDSKSSDRGSNPREASSKDMLSFVNLVLEDHMQCLICALFNCPIVLCASLLDLHGGLKIVRNAESVRLGCPEGSSGICHCMCKCTI